MMCNYYFRDASWGTKSSLVMIRGVVYRSKWPTLAYKTKSPVLKAGKIKSKSKRNSILKFKIVCGIIFEKHFSF